MDEHETDTHVANLALWERVKRPPAAALSTITGGRLKGMSDISPQWRYLALTREFGMCGFGWKLTVDKKWLEPGADGEIAAFVDVSLYIKVGDDWSKAIPGHGGSAFVVKEKVGTKAERLYTSDEAYKMAETDAVSVAFKRLGGGADIYLGQWDGKRYTSASEDTGKIADWMTLCRDASTGSLKEFKQWWPTNKGAVKESCSQAGAGEVYNLFAMLKKGMVDDENPGV